MLIAKETLFKNNLNVVKGVPLVYVNFIIIVIILPEKEIRGIIVVPPLVSKYCII